jgi:inhibitor of cysteine peptidase
MTKTLALSAIALAFVGACTGSEEENLEFVNDGGKTDVVRPLGTWERELVGNDAGFTHLSLNEDKTYDARQELVNCPVGECTEELAGEFRWASSNGNPYVVLYDQDGDRAYSFEYKQTTDSLSLRATGTTLWFTMEADSDRVELDENDDGETIRVQEGDDIVLSLPSNPSTGYSWVVASTDRSFGYPEEAFTADSSATGSGGTTTFTWKSEGPFTLIGPHSVTLEYKRPWDTTTPPEKTFTFTVDIWAPGP